VEEVPEVVSRPRGKTDWEKKQVSLKNSSLVKMGAVRKRKPPPYRVGQRCWAEWDEDKLWYRAEIVNVSFFFPLFFRFVECFFAGGAGRSDGCIYRLWKYATM
jgi:hypothetical protein